MFEGVSRSWTLFVLFYYGFLIITFILTGIIKFSFIPNCFSIYFAKPWQILVTPIFLNEWLDMEGMHFYYLLSYSICLKCFYFESLVFILEENKLLKVQLL